jgi:hypothetical protein
MPAAPSVLYTQLLLTLSSAVNVRQSRTYLIGWTSLLTLLPRSLSTKSLRTQYHSGASNRMSLAAGEALRDSLSAYKHLTFTNPRPVIDASHHDA